MSIPALKAHFDGEHILLDEPYPLLPATPLMVLVMPSAVDEERGEWQSLSTQNLGRAYGEDEPEYSLADLRRMP